MTWSFPMKPSRALLFVVLTLSLLAAYATLAQQPPREPPSEASPERPEYRARSLPTDTFKPSEEVQEDFPVPFPEDI